MKPIAIPMTVFGGGFTRTTSAATRPATIGTPPLIIPASDESIHCCAIGKRRNGTAIQRTPSATIALKSRRSTFVRAALNRASVQAPKTNLSRAINAGSNESSATSIHTNEDPQVSAVPVRSSQSRAENASRLAVLVGLMPVKEFVSVAGMHPSLGGQASISVTAREKRRDTLTSTEPLGAIRMSLDLSNLDVSTFALAPSDDAGRIRDHFVEIYDDDASLVDSLARFISLGLDEGETVFVVATREHRELLERRLGDLGAARDDGSYVALDAAAVLERLVVDGIPRAERFDREVGDMIEAATRGGRQVRVFGEMVALMWADGNVGGALSLEDLWNALADRCSFRLFCSYPSSGFGEQNMAPLRAVCHRHSHVITPPRRLERNGGT